MGRYLFLIILLFPNFLLGARGASSSPGGIIGAIGVILGFFFIFIMIADKSGGKKNNKQNIEITKDKKKRENTYPEKKFLYYAHEIQEIFNNMDKGIEYKDYSRTENFETSNLLIYKDSIFKNKKEIYFKHIGNLDRLISDFKKANIKANDLEKIKKNTILSLAKFWSIRMTLIDDTLIIEDNERIEI